MTITAPAANATIGGQIAIAGTASDDVAVLKVKYRVDRKGNFVQATGTTSWSGSINVSSYKEGPAVIWVRVVDTAGNVGETSVAVNINNGVTPAPAPVPSPSPSPSPTPGPSPSPSPGPSPALGTTVWGIFSPSSGSMSAQQVIGYLESKTGRQFSGQRIYSNMDDSFPSSVDTLMASQGGLLYHNINSFIGSGSTKVCISWASVAAGASDPWWISQALKIKAFGYPILLSFNHEPTVDNAIHPSCGTPAEYRAAYDHLVQLFAAQGVTNVKWVWTQTASTFNGHNGGPAAWEPAHYDIVGVDGYARASAWRTPQEIFQTAENWAKLRGKPLLIGEIGVEELSGNPNAKADWITAAGTMFKSYKNLLAVVWNNDPQYAIDSSPQALAAFAALGQDPVFGG